MIQDNNLAQLKRSAESTLEGYGQLLDYQMYAPKNEFQIIEVAGATLELACVYYLLDHCHFDNKKNIDGVIEMVKQFSFIERSFDSLDHDSTAWKYYTTYQAYDSKTKEKAISWILSQAGPIPSSDDGIKHEMAKAEKGSRLTGKQEKIQRERDAERSTFSSQPGPKKAERSYYPTLDAKATLINLLLERTVKDIKALAPQTRNYSFEEYTMLISALVRASDCENFNKCWNILCPNETLELKNTEFAALRQEASYYTDTCNMLFVDNKWGNDDDDN